MPTDRSEPTTAAGRALLDEDECWDKTVLIDRILAIEAEARQPDSEALRRVVANLTKSLLIAQDGESVSGGTAAVLWLRDVITLAALPPSDPPALPTASDLRGLVTDPAWGEGHRARDLPALDWRVTGSLAVLTEWAEGDEGEGCHWCLFSEGHEEGCPVGIARAVLDDRLSAQPEVQPAEDADAAILAALEKQP